MNKVVYVTMKDGVPVAAFTTKSGAWKHSLAIGGPGEGHAIAIIALSLDDPDPAPPGDLGSVPL